MAFFCFYNTGYAQEKPTKFRLELSTESVFIKGAELRRALKNDYFVVGKSLKNSTQISGFWRLGDRLDIGLGLAYTVRDVNTICYCLCDKVAPVGGVFTKIRSLDLPLELRWKWLKKTKRFDPFTSFGLNTRMPFNFNSRSHYNQAKLETKNTFLGLTLGVGTRIQIFEKWSAIIGLSAEKNRNFKFEKEDFRLEGSSRWLDEWSVSIGIGRNF